MNLDAFLSLTGNNAIAGESTDTYGPGTTNQIEVLQFSLSMTRESRSSAEVRPLTIFKPIDRASTSLYRSMTTKTIIGTATLTVLQPAVSPTANPARVILYQIVLTNAWISRISLVGNVPALPVSADEVLPGGALWSSTQLIGQGPIEMVDFAFAKISWTYNGATGAGGATVDYTLPVQSVPSYLN